MKTTNPSGPTYVHLGTHGIAFFARCLNKALGLDLLKDWSAGDQVPLAMHFLLVDIFDDRVRTELPDFNARLESHAQLLIHFAQTSKNIESFNSLIDLLAPKVSGAATQLEEECAELVASSMRSDGSIVQTYHGSLG